MKSKADFHISHHLDSGSTEVRKQFTVVQSEIQQRQELIVQNLEQLQTSNAAQLEQIYSDAQIQKEQILADLAKITPQEIAATALTEIQQNLQTLSEPLERLQQNHPQLFFNPDDFIEQGKQLLAQENYQEAIALFDRALELKSDNPKAWNQRGIALRELQRYEGAIAAFNKAVRI